MVEKVGVGQVNGASRVVLNIAATYGRSLVGLVCGLFTGRWVLMALGETDFGVWSVVAGLSAFVSFFNVLFAAATARFFALTVNRPEDCRAWFRVSVLVHLSLATSLVVIGYPMGLACIRDVLTVPLARTADVIFAFRLVCVSAWVGMASVPFVAMYTARQNIAELSVYGIVQSLAHLAFLGIAVTHPRDWFIAYAVVLTAINVVPNVLLTVGAVRRYESCRGWGGVDSFCRRMRELTVYAFWQMFGSLGYLARTQGVNLLLNRLAGTGANAAFGISSQVNGQVQSLSAALQGAFTPVITTAFGSGERDAASQNAMRACRLSLLLMLVFVVPLMLELRIVLDLWLVHPPIGSDVLCGAVLLAGLVDKATSGHLIILNAKGRLGAYQIVVGSLLAFSLPLAWGLYVAGLGLNGVGLALVIGSVLAGIGRVVFARCLVGLGIRVWMRQTVMPIAALALATLVVGALPRLFLESGLLRVGVTTVCTLVVFVPLAWMAVLTKSERQSVRAWRKERA